MTLYRQINFYDIVPLFYVRGCNCWFFYGLVFLMLRHEASQNCFGQLYDLLENLVSWISTLSMIFQVSEYCRTMTYARLVGKPHVFLMNHIELLNQ